MQVIFLCQEHVDAPSRIPVGLAENGAGYDGVRALTQSLFATKLARRLLSGVLDDLSLDNFALEDFEMMSLRFIAFHPIDRLDLPALRVNILYPSKPDVIRLLFPGKVITDILLWRKMN